jgi:hypothetical protein
VNKKRLQIVAWLVAMGVALGIAARLWDVAFPVAAVPFPLTRGEVQTQMQDFLGSMGAPVGEYRSAISFGESTETKNFIEREYGPDRLAKAARDGVDIWYWMGRWFKPEQHEEYQAWTDQEGNIVGYSHIIEEERKLPTLSEAQARALAEAFLQGHITRHPMAALRYLETGTEKKPHRTDYTFTWEQDSLRMGDAPYQLDVTVQGNEIGSYGEYLKVPEWWTVQYDRQRAVNDLCYRIASFAGFGIVLGLLITLLLFIRNHEVRWRNATPWGWLVVIGVVGAATGINGIPDTVFGYPTTEQWRPFVAGAIFNGVREVLGGVVLFWMLMVIGDCIYRKWLPGKSSFRRALGPLALRDRQTVRAMGVGIAFAVFSLAYVCLFYTVGQRLGVWCPVEIDLSKTMSGPMPWVEAMQTGLSAAFSEEMIFRVGAVLLLWRILRVRWLAVLLAAASWGFLHSNYPQMPGYTRGIELTIVGVVWGTLMLRYGVVATLTAHYLYDCWLGSLITFQTASWENKVGAIAVSVWPVALFLWGTFRKQAELEPEEAHTAARPHVPGPPPREWKHVPLGLSGKGIALLVLGCAAGLAAALFLPRPQKKIAELGRLDLSREAIIKKADAALRGHGYSPDGYERVTYVYSQGVPAAYLLEHGNLDELAGLYDKDFHDLCWSVRYFRFLKPEEFGVQLDQHGRVLTWSHTELREAPGAELDEGAALARAKEALAKDGGIDLAQQELVSEGPTQQEHRRDWFFAFDQKNFGWGDAKLRTHIWLEGNEAVSLTRFVKVPDAWILEHEKSGWKQLVSGEFQHWAGLVEDAILVVLMVLAIQKHLTPWRKAFLYALFPLGIKLVDQVNQAQQFYQSYGTTTPRAHYLIAQLGARAQLLVLTYLAGVFVIAVALGFLRWAWGWTPEQLDAWPADRRERGVYWRDTLLAAVASMVALWLLGLLDQEVLGYFWPAEAVTIRYWSVTEWAPWIGAVTEALQYAYGEMIRLAILASVLRLIWGRHPRLAWVLLPMLPLLSLGTPETLGGFLWGLAYAELTLLLTVWLVVKVWRFNVPAAFLTYFMATMWVSVTLFVRKGGPVYEWQAAPLVGLMAGALAVGWWRHRENSKFEIRIRGEIDE